MNRNANINLNAKTSRNSKKNKAINWSKCPFYRVPRILKFLLLKLVRTNHSPQDIAAGAAFGAFVGIVPTAGVAMLICIWAAPFLKINTFAAVSATWISNPWTYPIFYISGERLGAFLLNRTSSLTKSNIKLIVHEILKLWRMETPGQSSEKLVSIKSMLRTFENLYLGTAIEALFVASIVYWITLKLVIHYRGIKYRRKLAKALKKSKSLDIEENQNL